jgi:hypothetical protein
MSKVRTQLSAALRTWELWIGLLAYFGIAFFLFFIYLGCFWELRLFAPPPTLWQLTWPRLFIFGPPSLAVPWFWMDCARKRKSRGPSSSRSCPSCGYDLRATPDRCPECGTPTRSFPI